MREGDNASALRVKGNRLQKVPLDLARRDPRTGDYVLAGGLAEGDQVLRYPNDALKDGQAVQAAATPKTSMAVSAVVR